MERIKSFYIIALLIIIGSIFGLKISAQTCNTDCTLCLTEADCVASTASTPPIFGCEWNRKASPNVCQICSKTTETAWPPTPFDTEIGGCSTLVVLVKYIYEWGLSFGGIAVLLSLIYGGFLYLSSAGDPGKMREGKDRIFTALTGLVLLLSIFLILNTINPELTLLVMPQGGVGTACDEDTELADCGSGFVCEGDITAGDGNKDGICSVPGVGTTCNIDKQCWTKNCALPADCASSVCLNISCDKNVECPFGRCSDTNQTDGIPNGFCQELTVCDSGTAVTDCNSDSCLGDPTANDGKKEGFCEQRVCHDEKCSDRNQTDDKKEGMCKIPCYSVTFYGGTNCGGTADTPAIDTCKDTSVAGPSGVQIQSLKIKGNCSVFFYTEANETTCGSINYAIGGDVVSGEDCDYPNLNSTFGETIFWVWSVKYQTPNY